MKPKDTSTPDNAPVPGIYRHYKGPNYQVLGLARHSETEEWLVIYQALYAERGFWARPLSLWLEPVAAKAQTDSSNDTSSDETSSNETVAPEKTARFELVEENTHSLTS